MNDVMVHTANPLYLKPYYEQAEQQEAECWVHAKPSANTQLIDHMLKFFLFNGIP